MDAADCQVVDEAIAQQQPFEEDSPFCKNSWQTSSHRICASA